jgi:hypothetical protein
MGQPITVIVWESIGVQEVGTGECSVLPVSFIYARYQSRVICVTVRSPCRRSAAVEKRGSREVHFVELQSQSLQRVEREVVSGNIASRGASEILRRLRITQGEDGL